MKKILALLLCAVLLCSYAVPALAATNVAFTLAPESKTLQPGQEVKIKVKASGSGPVDAFGILLHFDEKVFEIAGGSNACDTIYAGVKDSEGNPVLAVSDFDEEKGGLATSFQTAQTLSNMEIGYITLKVRDDAPQGDTTCTGETAAEAGGAVIGTSCNTVTFTVSCGHSWGAWGKLSSSKHSRKCAWCTATESMDHTWSPATCTAPKTCSVCNATEGSASGHTWTAATCTAPKTCSVCTATQGNASGHSWVAATCTAPKTCSVCRTTEGTVSAHSFGQWAVVKAATPAGSGQEKRTCKNCTHFETRAVTYKGNGIVLTGELAKETTVYIEGLPYAVQSDGNTRYVELPKAGDTTLVTYTFHAGDGKDVHTQYPTGMKVYKVSGGKAIHIPELDNLLQYSGSSIRITGNKGIRMITSIDKTKKAALTGKGLAGYTLEEYGTVLCFAKEIASGDGLVLGRSFARSNYAYKKGVADPVFASTDKLVQYTNVLVGFSLDQCKDDIAMRPYIILKDAKGQKITLYGGTIYRSIGYIAYQNRSVFTPKTASYNYVWEIIHHVFGKQYDKDYKG